MASSKRFPAAMALLVAIISWAMAPVFIRYMREAYDPYSQALVRYAAGTLALVVVCWFGFRKEFLHLLKHPRAILGIALLNIVQQCTWTIGCYGSTATMAQLITKLNVVFVIILSYFLFHEERRVIRSPAYLLGTLLSFVGVAALLTSDPSSLVPVIDRSSVILLITAVCWSVYTVWGKHIVTDCHPIPMFTVLSLFTTIGFVVLSPALGRPQCIVEAGWRITAIAAISGVLPIATGHTAFHFGQKYLGSAFSGSCNLMTPFITYLIAIFVLDDEYLTASQWVGAGILIAGTGMVLWVGQRAHRKAAIS